VVRHPQCARTVRRHGIHRPAAVARSRDAHGRAVLRYAAAQARLCVGPLDGRSYRKRRDLSRRRLGNDRRRRGAMARSRAHRAVFAAAVRMVVRGIDRAEPDFHGRALGIARRRDAQAYRCLRRRDRVLRAVARGPAADERCRISLDRRVDRSLRCQCVRAGDALLVGERTQHEFAGTGRFVADESRAVVVRFRSADRHRTRIVQTDA
jgi:hypothetical protein